MPGILQVYCQAVAFTLGFMATSGSKIQARSFREIFRDSRHLATMLFTENSCSAVSGTRLIWI